MIENFDSEKSITKVIDNLKSKGTFDQFRRECLEDVDTKPSYRNLLQRVEGYVSKFLYKQNWNNSLNKNQIRNMLRNEINKSDMLKNGIEHLIDQVVNDKIKNQFKSKIEDSLHDYLGIKSEEPSKIEQKNEEETNIETESLDEIGLKSNETKESVKNNENSEIQLPEEIQKNSDNLENSFKECESDSPLPPKPEMLTPEHNKNKSVHPEIIDNQEEHVSNLESCNLVSELNNEIIEDKNNTVDYTTLKEVESNKNSSNENKNNLSDLSMNIENIPKTEVNKEDNENDEEMSDISSVHTSDLSDFDDAISIEDSDEDNEITKKKISIKVVKELAASISEDKEDSQKFDSPNINDDEDNNEKISTHNKNKRKRKINPKFMSSDFSYNLKRKKIKSPNDDETKEDKKDFVDKQSLKKKKKSENIEIKVAKSNPKLIPKKSSEPTNMDKPIKTKRNVKQLNRNERSNKRYDSSDLYKPRHSLGSTRRNRNGPSTPESNSNSTNEDN